MASADSGFTVSATVITAASSPSMATYIGVSPAARGLAGERLERIGDVGAGAVHHAPALPICTWRPATLGVEPVAGDRLERLQGGQGEAGAVGRG